MNPNYSYALPSMEYLKNCIEGYNDFGFNKKILEQAIETSYISIEKKLIR